MPIYRITMSEIVTRVFQVYVEAKSHAEAEDFCGEAEADDLAGHEIVKSVVEDGSVDNVMQVDAAPENARILNLSERT